MSINIEEASTRIAENRNITNEAIQRFLSETNHEIRIAIERQEPIPMGLLRARRTLTLAQEKRAATSCSTNRG